MKYTPIAILVLLWLELTNYLLARYATVVKLHDVHPEFHVFDYGRRQRTHDPDGWWESFFIVKLPSWQWMHADFGRYWCWHRLCVVWTSSRGWFTWYQRCED